MDLFKIKRTVFMIPRSQRIVKSTIDLILENVFHKWDRMIDPSTDEYEHRM